MNSPSKWDILPNEIWRIIFLNLVSFRGFREFLCINKPIFKIAAPILYKAIEMDELDETNGLISSLHNSRYQYGQYVKEVTFHICDLSYMDALLKSGWNVLENNTDFEWLMMSTPHVEEFYWFHRNDHLYDNLAVSRHLWKLKCIHDPDVHCFGYNEYKMMADVFKATLTWNYRGL